MKPKSANSSSLSPLESLWLAYQRLLGLADKRRKKAKAYEAVYWIGYQRALRDIGSAITSQIFQELVEQASLGGISVAQPTGSEALQPDADLQQVQKLPRQAK